MLDADREYDPWIDHRGSAHWLCGCLRFFACFAFSLARSGKNHDYSALGQQSERKTQITQRSAKSRERVGVTVILVLFKCVYDDICRHQSASRIGQTAIGSGGFLAAGSKPA
jgi:hypothetical protein